MSLQDISGEILTFAGTFNIWLIVSIFFLLAINEFGLSIPYLMETVWILAGFHARTLSLSAFQLVFLLLVAMAGRLAGALLFYSLIGLGSTWIMQLYQRLFGSALSKDKAANPGLLARILRRLNFRSPYTVAFGRLIWLKVPLTLTLSVQRELRVLLLAVALSSAVWDITYVLIGVIGGSAHLESSQTVLYSLAALTVIYGASFLIRRLLTLRMSAGFGKPVD